MEYVKYILEDMYSDSTRVSISAIGLLLSSNKSYSVVFSLYFVKFQLVEKNTDLTSLNSHWTKTVPA